MHVMGKVNCTYISSPKCQRQHSIAPVSTTTSPVPSRWSQSTQPHLRAWCPHSSLSGRGGRAIKPCMTGTSSCRSSHSSALSAPQSRAQQQRSGCRMRVRPTVRGCVGVVFCMRLRGVVFAGESFWVVSREARRDGELHGGICIQQTGTRGPLCLSSLPCLRK